MHRNRSVVLWVLVAFLAAALTSCSPGGPPLPDPPIAVDDAYLTPFDTTLTIPAPGVLDNDTPNGGTADAGQRATTGGGSADLAADGGFTYQPAPGYTGLDTFTYTITNASGTSAPATVTIEVPAAPWVEIPDLPTAVSRPASAVVRGVPYVFGGETSGGGREHRVFAFDRTLGAWAEGAESMPTPVSNLCAVAIGTDVYVPSGWTAAGVVTPNLQVYHTASDSWTVVASDPVPVPVAGPACAAHDGKIYMFGGNDTATYWDLVQRYDPSAPAGTRWTTTLAPIPEATGYSTAVAIGDLVFVVGGRTSAISDKAEVFAYEPATDTWTTFPSLTVARGGPGAWASGPYLYVGGGGWWSYHASVEVYDTSLGATGSWAAAPELNTGRRTFAHATDRDSGWFYAVGGWNGAFSSVAEQGLLRALP